MNSELSDKMKQLIPGSGQDEISPEANEPLTLEQVEAQIAQLESYRAQLLDHQQKSEHLQYDCAKSGNRNIVVIGGGGQLGGLFVRLFERSGYQLVIIEAEDWHSNPQMIKRSLACAALVLVAVPIHLTEGIIEQLTDLPNDCVLADITSIKQKPLSKMLAVHQGSVVGLHPMFGPGVNIIKAQTIVVCHGRKEQEYQWLTKQLAIWGANIHQTSAREHDETMAIVQVLRHFSTIAYGAHLEAENVCLKQVLAMSSPIYRLELAMVGRLFAQAPELYTEIIFANADNNPMVERYISGFEKLLDLIKTGDKEGFIQAFLKTREWFGEYADKFLVESSQMLASTKSSS